MPFKHIFLRASLSALTHAGAKLFSGLMLCAWIWLIPLSGLAGIDYDRMLMLARERYGEPAYQTIQELRGLIAGLKAQSELDKVREINRFVNHKITHFEEDIVIWGQSDYWATPLESLGKRAGDCEDYSIAKYMFLKAAGIPTDKLRLTYVRAQIGGPQSKIFQAHMVLGYYADANADPLILDNLISDVRPASRRPDLRPIFAFNDDGIWVGGTKSTKGDSSTHLSRWRDLLKRARDEGIE